MRDSWIFCPHGVPPYALCGVCHPKEMQDIMEGIKREWRDTDGPCPYCKINGPCKHWFGCGWSNPSVNSMEETK